MRRPPRTRLFAASVATLAALTFSACGGDDDTTSSDATVSTAAGETTPTDDTMLPNVDDTSGVSTTPSSGGGEVAAQEEYIEAAKGEVDFEDGEINDCFAEAIVNDDVYAAIEENGLTLEDFESDGPVSLGVDEAVAADVASAAAACGDLLPQVLTDETEIECAQENLSNEQLAEYLVFSLLGAEPSDEVTAANEAVEVCLAGASTTTTG